MSEQSASRASAISPGMVMIALTVVCLLAISIIFWYYFGHLLYQFQVLIVKYLIEGSDYLMQHLPAIAQDIFWKIIAVVPAEEAHIRKALLGVHNYRPGFKDREIYWSLLAVTGMFLRPFFLIFAYKLIRKTRTKYIAEKYTGNPSPKLVRTMGEMVAPQIRQSGFHVDRIEEGMFRGVARASLQPIEYAIAAGAIKIERAGEKYMVVFKDGVCDEIINYHRAPTEKWVKEQIVSKSEGFADLTGVVTVDRFDMKDVAKLKNADHIHYDEDAILKMAMRDLGPEMDFESGNFIANRFDDQPLHGHPARPPISKNISDMRKMVIGFLYAYYQYDFKRKKTVKKELEKVNRALSPKLAKDRKSKKMKPVKDMRGQWVTDYDFSKHLSYYNDAIKDPAFMREAIKYKYLYSFAIALMRFANSQGNFIPSEMHFIMFYDREFWFAIHNADRPSPHPEALAAFFSFDASRAVQGVLERNEALIQVPFNIRAQLEFDRWEFSGEAALQPISMGDEK